MAVKLRLKRMGAKQQPFYTVRNILSHAGIMAKYAASKNKKN